MRDPKEELGIGGKGRGGDQKREGRGDINAALRAGWRGAHWRGREELLGCCRISNERLGLVPVTFHAESPTGSQFGSFWAFGCFCGGDGVQVQEKGTLGLSTPSTLFNSLYHLLFGCLYHLLYSISCIIFYFKFQSTSNSIVYNVAFLILHDPPSA